MLDFCLFIWNVDFKCQFFYYYYYSQTWTQKKHFVKQNIKII